MTQFEIKLSGSGTTNQIIIALLEFGRELQSREMNAESIEGTFEDSILCAEVTEC